MNQPIAVPIAKTHLIQIAVNILIYISKCRSPVPLQKFCNLLSKRNYVDHSPAFFAPMIYLKIVAPAIEFYEKAFDAVVLRQWHNDDGSVHVAEMSIGGALFHLHEEVTRNNEFSPGNLNGTTIAIGLFVNDPHTVMAKAVAAEGMELDPVRDYDYEYRQGCVKDPFGHHWLLEKKIG